MRFVALDLETTGLHPNQGAEIIEIGAAKFTLDGGVADRFAALCRPSGPIPRSATRVNGITDAHVQGSRDAWTEWQAFLQWAGEFDYFVFHNAPFDARFLDSLHAQNQATLPDVPVLDTLTLARRRLEAPSYKLTELAAHLNLQSESAHRAGGDAYVTAQLCMHVLSTYKSPRTALKNNQRPLSSYAAKAREEEDLERRLQKVAADLEASRPVLEEYTRRVEELTREPSPSSSSGGVAIVVAIGVVVLVLIALLG